MDGLGISGLSIVVIIWGWHISTLLVQIRDDLHKLVEGDDDEG